MSQRVHSNIGWGMDRKLGKAFGGNALGIVDPNTLGGGLTIAMGRARQSGMCSFEQYSGANMNITVWSWNDIMQKWCHIGPVPSVYTINLDDSSTASITVSEGMILFFQGSATSVDFCTGGIEKYKLNPVADLVK